MEFANGSLFKLSAEFLRINSPAVDGKIRSIGGEKVTSPFKVICGLTGYYVEPISYYN